MFKHLIRMAGWSLFEKGVEKTVDAKFGHLLGGPGVKPKRNPPPPTTRPYFPEGDDDDDDDDEWDEDDIDVDDDDDDDDDEWDEDSPEF
jgi:hypothetical protein